MYLILETINFYYYYYLQKKVDTPKNRYKIDLKVFTIHTKLVDKTYYV